MNKSPSPQIEQSLKQSGSFVANLMSPSSR